MKSLSFAVYFFLLRSWSLGGGLCALFRLKPHFHSPLLDFLSFLLLLLELLVEHFHDFFVIDAFVDFALDCVKFDSFFLLWLFRFFLVLLVHGLYRFETSERIELRGHFRFWILWRLFFALTLIH